MPRTMRRRLDAGAVVCLTTVFLLALACYAFAEPPSTSATAEGAAATNTGADPGQAAQPGKDRDDSKAGRRRAPLPSAAKTEGSQPCAKGDRSPDPQPELEGPPPRWACDASLINLEPVGAGKTLRAAWVVRNDGEGDLVIKVKGG